MTYRLQRWIVRRSNYPFAIPGKPIGVVEATDKTAAAIEAAKHFSGALVLEAEARVNPELERVVDRAVKAAGRRAKGRASGWARPRQQPLNPTLKTPDGDAA